VGLLHSRAGRPDEAIALLEPAVREAADLGEAPEAIALRAGLARAYFFADRPGDALPLIDEVLVSAGRVDDVPILADAVITKGTMLSQLRRSREGTALLVGGLDLAQTHGLVQAELRARLNLSHVQSRDEPARSLETAQAGLERARRLGFRDWATVLAGNVVAAKFTLGDWDGIERLVEEVATASDTGETGMSELHADLLAVRALRGDHVRLAEDLAALEAYYASATASQERAIVEQVHLWAALGTGRLREAARAPQAPDPANQFISQLVVGHAVAWLGDTTAARTAADAMAGYHVIGRWASAMRLGLESTIAGMEGHARDAADGYREALATLTDLGARRDVALLHLDRVASAPDETEALAAADAARPLLVELRAPALQERLDALLAGRVTRAQGEQDDAAATRRGASEVRAES
jgi:hypothetical protein